MHRGTQIWPAFPGMWPFDQAKQRRRSAAAIKLAFQGIDRPATDRTC